MNSLVTFLLLVIILLILLYAKYRQKIRFWKRHGVESISILELYKRSKKKPWGINLNKFYQQMYAEKKPFKVIELLFESLLLVQDLEAIKDIMITNFESFPDRGLYVNHREALSANVSRLDYDMWKPLRMKMSPTFSPAKLRHMFPNLLGVAKQLVAVLGEQCDKGQGGEVQMFDLCARFTTDIIGNVAFGIECNSLREPNTEFRVQGNRAFYQTLNPLWDMIGAKFPKLMALFNVHVFSREANELFKKVFRDTMEHRQKNNIRRNDFMDLLLELQKEPANGEDFKLTFDLMVGQLFVFFIAGFETTSCVMTYALYELATNPPIQEKVRREILQIMAKHKRNLTYESLKNMKFLKAVIQETLRKNTIVGFMPRVCRRSCTIRTSCNSPLTIQKGTSILIPIHGVLHNPDLYAEPDTFLPERFLEGEKEANKIDRCSFMAFGIGPKVCIGEPFARLELSLALALLLSEFQFSVCDKTPSKLIFDPKKRFMSTVKNGVHLSVKRLRHKEE